MKKPLKNTKKLLSIGQAARMFGVHRDTLRNWERDGLINPLRVGKRQDRKYRLEDLEKIIDNRSIIKDLDLQREKKMDLAQLKKFLWDSADILRGKMDAAEYKRYIFGLLFFKRISDVWYEEYQDMMEQYKDDDIARADYNHRFQLPDGCDWETVRKKSTHIGREINRIFKKIEDANSPKLDNVFRVNFADINVLSNEVLQELINHFSQYNFGNNYISSDLLGDAYEYLIAQFAADAGKKGGEFYTPREVEQVIIKILKPEGKDHIYDMTVGSGGFLLEAYHYLKDKKDEQEARSLYLYGQEMSNDTFGIAKINMFLHGLDSADIRKGDTLADPKFLNDDGSLKIFDICVANPPYSVSQWEYDTFTSSRFGRTDGYAAPPRRCADYAFVLHMIASMNETGRAGIVLPNGVLFRASSERRIREQIVRNDFIEAIIALPKNLFYGTSIPAVVIIFNKKKQKAHKRKVLFINAEYDFETGRNQNRLRKEDINKIVSAFGKYNEVEGYSAVATIDDIEKKDFNLNVSLYVTNVTEEEDIDVSKAWGALCDLEKKQAAADRKVAKYIKELKY